MQQENLHQAFVHQLAYAVRSDRHLQVPLPHIYGTALLFPQLEEKNLIKRKGNGSDKA